MFRRKRQQKTIFDHDVYLPPKRVAALEASRAGPFRSSILLAKEFPDLYKKLPALYEEVYRKRAGYFADSKSSRAKRRLAKCAVHLFDLVDRFRDHPGVGRMKYYLLMARLLEEQCVIDATEPGKVCPKQESKDFKERYKIRSGIEATISETDRVTGLKRILTRGKVRVTASLFLKAPAVNVKRFVNHALQKMKNTDQGPSKGPLPLPESVSLQISI